MRTLVLFTSICSVVGKLIIWIIYEIYVFNATFMRVFYWSCDHNNVSWMQISFWRTLFVWVSHVCWQLLSLLCISVCLFGKCWKSCIFKISFSKWTLDAPAAPAIEQWSQLTFNTMTFCCKSHGEPFVFVLPCWIKSAHIINPDISWNTNQVKIKSEQKGSCIH